MLRITTNNVPRFTVDGRDLTPAERANHDYLGADLDDATFIRYKGYAYYLGDFVIGAPNGWDGIASDTYFSGIVIRFPDPHDTDSVVVGRYMETGE